MVEQHKLLGVATLLASMVLVPACGDDDVEEMEEPEAGSGSTAPTAGTSSTPGTVSCGDETCEPFNLPVGGVTLDACCTEANTCGFDGSMAEAFDLDSLLGGGDIDPDELEELGVEGADLDEEDLAQLEDVDLEEFEDLDLSCVDANELLGGGGEELEDGPIHDGEGNVIVIDNSCPGIQVSALDVVDIDLQGCCRPDGLCGGSAHDSQELGAPFICADHEDVDEFIDELVGGLGDDFGVDVGDFVDLPPDPMQECDFPDEDELDDPAEGDAGIIETDAGALAPDAGVSDPDAGVPDAAVPDAG